MPIGETWAFAPYLTARNAGLAIEFYRTVFGAAVEHRLLDPAGKVAHAQLTIGEVRLMISDEYPQYDAVSPLSLGGTPVKLHLYVVDVDAVTERFRRAGGIIAKPPTDEFFGDRVAMGVDPFGHHWSIAARVEQVDDEEMQRRWGAMMEEGGA